jgi:uncharacterized protein YcbX
VNGRVASLHIYPVKSCRGIDVDSALVVATGFEWDRRWMIVDARGRFITQRSHPKLATVATAIVAGELWLSAEGRETLVVPGDHGGERRDVVVWDDHCLGIDAGEEAAAWLSDHLGQALRLVRKDESVLRQANPEWAGPVPQPVAFSDAYPLLLISRASLEELNRRLPAPLPMNRFRPNVVIDGVAAHAEDAMTVFRFGTIALRGVKHCTRCATTTTDQATGARHSDQEPLRTLKTYRNDRKLKGVTFGQNCLVHAGVGSRLAVGAALTID